MNHIVANFTDEDGIQVPHHIWEKRQDAFKRVAVVFSPPFWKPGEDRAFTDFLLERDFIVVEPETGFIGSLPFPRSFSSFVKTAKSFLAHVSGKFKVPFYLFSGSFSSILAAAACEGLSSLAAVSYTAPVFSLPRQNFSIPFWPWAKWAKFQGSADFLSELPDEIIRSFPDTKWSFRMAREAAVEIRRNQAEREKAFSGQSQFLPTAIFCGEEDPFADEPLMISLSSAKAGHVFRYPRVKHIVGYGKYAKNYYADLGGFIDMVASGSGS